MICDVCGLPDCYRGQGDGIGSCDCPRCDCCRVARSSTFCTGDPNRWDDDYRPWPDDDQADDDGPDIVTIQPSGAYL